MGVKMKRSVDTFKFILANFYFVLLRKPLAIKLLGLKNKRSKDRIEIDLTYACQLKCYNCNRSCRQAPGVELISIEQIKKFVNESKNKGVKWNRIRVLGGEPTLHPDLISILRLLLEYKTSYSPDTCIQLVTHGFDEKTREICKNIPQGIVIMDSSKSGAVQFFSSFNLAPVDFPNYKEEEYSEGCINYIDCGIGLNRYGYYCCGNAAGIDRVFGFDIGRKNIPEAADPMIDQLQVFCPLCGYHRRFRLTRKELISPVWSEAYKKYEKSKPKMTPY
ncbi:MAG: radical SAM protein [Candidatus Omnitrophica bacterium]|nr:radical SAM protein [Candidatus Omnitrophota bacterium]